MIASMKLANFLPTLITAHQEDETTLPPQINFAANVTNDSNGNNCQKLQVMKVLGGQALAGNRL